MILKSSYTSLAVAVALITLSVSVLTSAQDSPKVQGFQRLIDRYCVTCHNDDLNTANLRLDDVRLEHLTERGDIWEKVVHKLRTNAMPPADSPQLSRGAQSALLGWMVTELDAAAAENPNPGRPATHRLNRSEYTNAIRDLLNLEIDGPDLLPTDGSEYGFDNNADALGISPMLLERYMLAAAKISRQAIGDPKTLPSVQTYDTLKQVTQDERLGDEFSFGTRGGISVRHPFPLDAEYVIEVNASSTDQLEIRVAGERIKFFDGDGNEQEPKGDDDDWEAEAKELPNAIRFTAKAGTHPITMSYLKRTLAPEGIAPRRMPVRSIGGSRSAQPFVTGFTIAGPYNAQGISNDNPSRKKIFTRYPSGPDDELEIAVEIVSTLARRAYRRPLTSGDVETLLQFYTQGSAKGGFDTGIQWALERILVDPEFLYRLELDAPDLPPSSNYRLPDLELASRLSFFLWSSIPDEELLDIAERGELKNPDVLEQQVRRMLSDKRSETLVSNFASQWLHLRNVRGARPDVNLFPEFDYNLREAMEKETELFIADQLRQDKSIIELLSADYTFVNERLARHYDIPNVYGSRFRRVELSEKSNRGGLMSHASLLTVTSYATRTSPVRRGKWLLDNVLGSPPPPPPANVPDLPETGEGGEAATMRERMELHRKDPLCASCHVKMDPMGFALENFNAIGKWRTEGQGDLPIDSVGKLPDGTILDGAAGLREVVLSQGDEFVYTVTQKLLTYALGRGVEHYDQPAVRKIMREAAADDHSWSSVILGVVESTPFQMRRTL